MAYWTGWLITLVLGFLIFRRFVRMDYRQHGKLGVMAVLLEFVIFGLHANLIYLTFSVPWPQLPPNPDNSLQLYLGSVITGLGLLSTVGIMAYLGFGASMGQTPAGVRSSGPYRYTRNPQLLSYGITLLGIWILYPSLEVAAWILLYTVLAYFMVTTEEEHLSNVFGKEYEEYCRNVPRFLVHWDKIKISNSKDNS